MKYSENKPKRRNEMRGSLLLGMKLEPEFWKLSKSPCTLREKSALDFSYRYSKNMHAVQGSHCTGCQQNTNYQDQSFSKCTPLAFILGFILITSSFPVAECLPRPQMQAEQISPILSSTARTLLPNNMNPSSSFQFYMTMNPTPIQMQQSSTNRNTGIYPAQSIMVFTTNEGATQRFSQTADPQIISSPQMLTTRFQGFHTEAKTAEETKQISSYGDNIYQDFEGKHPGLNKTEDLLSQSHQIPSKTNPNQLIAPQTVSTSASVTPDPGSRVDLSMLNPDVSHLQHNKNKNLTGHQNKLQAHKATDSPALSEYLKNKYHQKHSNQTRKEMERNNKKLLDQYLPIQLTNTLVKPNENEELTKYDQVNTENPLLRQADTDADTPPATETKNKKIKEINTKKSHAIGELPLVQGRIPLLPQYNKFVRNRAFYSSRAETGRERQKNSNTSTSIIEEDKTKNSDSPRLDENPHVNSKQSVQSLSFPYSPASPTSRSTYLNLFARLPLLFRTEIGNETEKANTGTNNENNEGYKKDSNIAVSISSTPVNIGILSDDSDSASNVAHKTVGEDFITVVKKDPNPQVMKKPILLPVTDIADTGRVAARPEMENNRNHMTPFQVQFQPQENSYNHNSTTSEAEALITKAEISVESLPGLLEKLPETESTRPETKPELVLIVTEEDSQLLRKPKLPLQAIGSTGSGSVPTTTDDTVITIINQNQGQDDNNHEIKEKFTSKSESQSPALEQDININQNKKLTSPLLQLHQVFQVPPQEKENREMSESLLALTETPSSGLEIESSEAEAEAVVLTTLPTTPAPVPIFQEIKFQSFPFLISPPFVTIDGSFMGGKVPPLSLLDELGPVL